MNRLQTADWLERRKLILIRDSYTCRQIHLGNCVGELDVHHLYPFESRHSDNCDILITACDSHHRKLEIKYKIMSGLTNFERQMIDWNKEHPIEWREKNVQ